MDPTLDFLDPRRLAPRIAVDGLCGIVTPHDLRPARMVDLCAVGLRFELPYDPDAASPMLQLEIELPDIDELVWARAQVTSWHLAPMRGHRPDEPRLWYRAGVRIDRAASRERRLLRDYVIETRRVRQRAEAAAAA